ncbi:MAG: NAD(P)/FAD-dependent oxidoreductase [Hyphomicrobiaceae bacterium]
MDDIEHVVVVGAGQAGASGASRLRTLGYKGAISLIGMEPVPPYQRPPLTKKYLMGELDFNRLLIKPEDFYSRQDIELHLDLQVINLDRQHQTVLLSDGRTMPWDRLLLSVGARPKRLPEALHDKLANIHTVRTLEDVNLLAPRLSEAQRALIIGGGYIGLETAAVIRQRGVETILLEAADRILQRVASEETSRRMAELHQAYGVEIYEQAQIKSIDPVNDHCCSVRLDGDRQFVVDLVIVGVGVVPETDLAERAGLAVCDGIVVDEFCRTSDPRIFAAGDCASFPWRGRRVRLESIQNANEQAETAAANILGQELRYNPTPWFWSDQYEVKLQIAGLNMGYDRIVERRGKRDGTGSVWYFAHDKLLAVDAFNDGTAYMVGKRLIEAGRSPKRTSVANPDIPLKSLLGEDQ